MRANPFLSGRHLICEREAGSSEQETHKIPTETTQVINNPLQNAGGELTLGAKRHEAVLSDQFQEVGERAAVPG